MPEPTTHSRIAGVRRPVDTGTVWVTKTFPSDESLGELTPEAIRWAAEQMRAHALSHVNAVFDWVVADVPEVGKGCVAFMMAEAGMSTGRALHSALIDLLADADRNAGVCAEPDNPDCQCGACAYASATETEHIVAAAGVRVPSTENDAVMAL